MMKSISNDIHIFFLETLSISNIMTESNMEQTNGISWIVWLKTVWKLSLFLSVIFSDEINQLAIRTSTELCSFDLIITTVDHQTEYFPPNAIHPMRYVNSKWNVQLLEWMNWVHAKKALICRIRIQSVIVANASQLHRPQQPAEVQSQHRHWIGFVTIWVPLHRIISR